MSHELFHAGSIPVHVLEIPLVVLVFSELSPVTFI